MVIHCNYGMRLRAYLGHKTLRAYLGHKTLRPYLGHKTRALPALQRLQHVAASLLNKTGASASPVCCNMFDVVLSRLGSASRSTLRNLF